MNTELFRSAYDILGNVPLLYGTYKDKVFLIKTRFDENKALAFKEEENPDLIIFWTLLQDEKAIRNANVYFEEIGLLDDFLRVEQFPLFRYIHFMDKREIYTSVLEVLSPIEIIALVSSPIMSQKFFDEVCSYYQYREHLINESELERLSDEYGFNYTAFKMPIFTKETELILRTPMNELKALQESSLVYSYLFRFPEILETIAKKYFLIRSPSLEVMIKDYYAESNMSNIPLMERVNKSLDLSYWDVLEILTAYDIEKLFDLERQELINKIFSLRPTALPVVNLFTLLCETAGLQLRLDNLTFLLKDVVLYRTYLVVVCKSLKNVVTERRFYTEQMMRQVYFGAAVAGSTTLFNSAFSILKDDAFKDCYFGILSKIHLKLSVDRYYKIATSIIARLRLTTESHEFIVMLARLERVFIGLKTLR